MLGLIGEGLLLIFGAITLVIVWTLLYFVVGFGYTLAQVGVGLLEDNRKNRRKR